MDALTQALLAGTLGIGRHGVGEAVEADHDAHVRERHRIIRRRRGHLNDPYRSEHVRQMRVPVERFIYGDPPWGVFSDYREPEDVPQPEDSWDAWRMRDMSLVQAIDRTPHGIIETRRTDNGYVVSMNGAEVTLSADVLRRAAIGSLNEMTAAFARGDIEAGAAAYQRVAALQWCDDHADNDAHVRAWEARTVPRGWRRRADGAIAPNRAPSQ